MTFEELQSSTNPNVRPNPFTQEIGIKPDAKSFEQQPLLRNEHEDPDLHLIGQGLPAPSTAELTYAGRLNSTGDSPFPARADHTHDVEPRWSLYYRDNQTVGPGLTFINGWTHTGGANILAPASTQVFLFPSDGIWQVSIMGHIGGAGGANMTGQFRWQEYWFNGTYARYPWSSMTAGATTHSNLSFSWTSYYHMYTYDAAQNLQFAYLQNDIINHNIHIEFLQIIRVSRYI